MNGSGAHSAYGAILDLHPAVQGCSENQQSASEDITQLKKLAGRYKKQES